MKHHCWDQTIHNHTKNNKYKVRQNKGKTGQRKEGKKGKVLKRGENEDQRLIREKKAGNIRMSKRRKRIAFTETWWYSKMEWNNYLSKVGNDI